MLEQGQLGAKDATERGGVVAAAPQGKLGAAISGQPSLSAGPSGIT